MIACAAFTNAAGGRPPRQPSSVPVHTNHQHLLGKLRDEAGRSKGPPFMGAFLDDVAGTDMVRPHRSEPGKRSFNKPELPEHFECLFL